LARVRGASRDAATLLELDGNLYEMQEWIEAERCARNEGQARAAGTALATMHREFQKFDVVVGLPQGGFSDCTRVRLKLSRALQRLNESIDPAHQSALRSVGALLDAHVMRAGDKLEAKGIALQREMPCHGDFHPGNTMWVGDTLRAVIDFDRARTEFAAAEISNAMLQFSTHPRAGSDPLAWTVGLEAERLRGFAEGYRAVNAIDLSTVAPFAVADGVRRRERSGVSHRNRGKFRGDSRASGPASGGFARRVDRRAHPRNLRVDADVNALASVRRTECA
jgi:Ser/Thr protein kinase RdoA (MazF antagonist)